MDVKSKGGSFMKKVSFIFVSLIIITMLISSNGLAEEKMMLQFWGISGAAEGEAQRELVAQYEKMHPELKFELKEGAMGLTDGSAFLAAIAGGETPDLSLFDGFTVAEFAARGAFMALDDLIAESETIKKEDFLEYAWVEGSFEGKVYAIRHDMSTWGFSWNKKHYEEVGLDPETPPKDWDQFLEYTEKLTKWDEQGNLERIGVDDMFRPAEGWLPLAWQLGGDWVSEDGRTVTLNTQPFIDSAYALMDLAEIFGGRAKFTDFGQVTEVMAGLTLYSAERSSQFYNCGVWILGPMKRYAPDLASHIGLVPNPPLEGGTPYSFMGGWSVIIPRGTEPERAKAAFGFIEHFMKPENRLLYAKAGSKLPTTWSGLEVIKKEIEENPEDFFASDIWLAFIDLAKIGRGRTPTPFNFLIWQEMFRAIDRFTYKEMSVEEALNESTNKVQREFDKFYRRRK